MRTRDVRTIGTPHEFGKKRKLPQTSKILSTKDLVIQSCASSEGGKLVVGIGKEATTVVAYDGPPVVK
jgi:hypothetical protein